MILNELVLNIMQVTINSSRCKTKYIKGSQKTSQLELKVSIKDSNVKCKSKYVHNIMH